MVQISQTEHLQNQTLVWLNDPSAAAAVVIIRNVRHDCHY